MAELVDELEELIRGDLLIRLGPDPSGELAAAPLASLLITYFNWRARFVPRRPRQCHRSKELLASPKLLEHQTAIDAIVKKIEAGDDLEPHLSRRVETAYEPASSRPSKNQRRTDLDLLVAEWGLHHLHLTTMLESDGFVQRTDDLLFASFRPGDAYLIGVFGHGNWTQIDLVSTCVGNWPDAGIFRQVQGVIGLAQSTAEADRPLLRNAGVTTMLEIDGKVYAPQGQTTAGTPMEATSRSNQIMRTLGALRETLRDRPEDLAQMVRDSGFDLKSEPHWEAKESGGWYGILEKGTGAFHQVVTIED